jgi:hypothetical protein
MRIELVAPKIYALIGQNSEEVANVMIRIQENYESPKFRNKVFTLKEFIPWYMKSKGKDTFTYFDDWSGFNVPGHIVRRFMNGKFNPLRPEEQWLVDEIKRLDIKDKFYLLGYAENDARVIKHEIAHGLFYTNRKYRKEVLAALSVHETSQDLVGELKNHGYCDEVLVDEYHAWTLTDSQWLKEKGIWTEGLDKLKQVLEDIFNKYTAPKKPRKTRSDKGKKRYHCSGYGWCELHGEHGP